MGQRVSPVTIAFLGCIAAAALLNPASIPAQGGFDSGSTGADGAFNPLASQTVQVPESGVLNYTSINIPAGVTITFNRNSKNTPVVILATSAVTIAGIIDLNGANGTSNGPAAKGGAGGPGGFDGGRGGYPAAEIRFGISGEGPGGGGGGGLQSNCARGGGGGGFSSAGVGGDSNCGTVPSGSGGQPGLIYGSNSLLPLIGGSGGGGGVSGGGVGGSGGGGGGAVLIASSSTITFSSGSVVRARGGNGQNASNNYAGGGGSGGAIRLIANKITGPTSIQVNGGAKGATGSGTADGGAGGTGYVRIEAFDFNGFAPTVTPSGTQTFSSFGLPSSITLPGSPALSITSVAGLAAPQMPAGSFNAPADIVVPSSQANPVTVALQAANIPLGTVVDVTIRPDTGFRTTVQSTPLAGTVATSTAAADLDLPATGISIISATASYNEPMTGRLMIDGQRINRVEVATSFGGQSEVTYLTDTGKRIKRSGR